uniref:Uncharacterized protein n=1 Tax=Heterorhabditis bacteriophora TaxID=37862 RepID=A0A1I7WQ89_HETBA
MSDTSDAIDITPKKVLSTYHQYHVSIPYSCIYNKNLILFYLKFLYFQVHAVGSYNGRIFYDRDVTFSLGEGSEVGGRMV